jgi:hypothetical protein
MNRTHSLLFIIGVLSLSWFLMMALHEFGHVVGAIATGGVVERVVLHPLTISRTDVSPNPNPLVVVWLGPLLGCLVPLLFCWAVPPQFSTLKKLALFFAGFCLIANGAYIAIGAFDNVGDCATMLKHGSPLWTLLVFGGVAATAGFYIWHRLGSIKDLPKALTKIDHKTTWALLALLVILIGCEFILSPM